MANRKDLANGILALGVSDTDTTWVLQNGYGAGMPEVPFYLTATPFGQLSTMGNSEIVNVTARTTDTLTVQRGAKGTTAKAFDAGAVVANGIYTDEKWTSDNIDWTTLESSPLTDFQDGEVYELPYNTVGSMLVTSGRTTIYFDIPLPKRLNGLVPKFNDLNAELRMAGGYITSVGAGIHDLLSLSTAPSIYDTGASLTVALIKKSGEWHSVNNDVGTVMFKSGEIEFSEPNA